jgi:hypothetical protein
MCYLIGEAIGLDRPRSQGGVCCCRDEDQEWNDEGIDDDTDAYLYRDYDDEELFHLCDDTTVGKAWDGCGVPLCPIDIDHLDRVRTHLWTRNTEFSSRSNNIRDVQAACHRGCTGSA